MPTVEQTLEERGSRYGAFSTHATITQGLKDIMKGSPKWHTLADDQKECLEMVAHKVGRILNGDPNYADSWVDIAGYAQLVARRLEQPRTGDIVEVDDLRRVTARQQTEEMPLDEVLRQYDKTPFTDSSALGDSLPKTSGDVVEVGPDYDWSAPVDRPRGPLGPTYVFPNEARTSCVPTFDPDPFAAKRSSTKQP